MFSKIIIILSLIRLFMALLTLKFEQLAFSKVGSGIDSLHYELGLIGIVSFHLLTSLDLTLTP